MQGRVKMNSTSTPRLDGDGYAARRMLHVSYSRHSWECNTTGRRRGPATTLSQAADADPKFGMKGLVPRRLALSDDAATRLFYSNWTPSMHEWAAEGFDPEYKTRKAAPGSPDPALRSVSRSA